MKPTTRTPIFSLSSLVTHTFLLVFVTLVSVASSAAAPVAEKNVLVLFSGELYRWPIVGAIAFIILQTLLIVVLLLSGATAKS